MAHNTISLFVPQVCDAITEEYQDGVLVTPTTPDGWKEVAEGFGRRWNFYHACRAIDGKHIRIKKPSMSGSAFHNYKGFFSIVLLGLVDSYGPGLLTSLADLLREIGQFPLLFPGIPVLFMSYIVEVRMFLIKLYDALYSRSFILIIFIGLQIVLFRSFFLRHECLFIRVIRDDDCFFFLDLSICPLLFPCFFFFGGMVQECDEIDVNFLVKCPDVYQKLSLNITCL